MSEQTPDQAGNEALGRIDDESEEQQASDDAADGPAAHGDYDPAEGSPGHENPPAATGDVSR